jgi:predicted glycosyltransferase
MRILVDIGHPGHVHFFKHAIRRWKALGHDVFVSSRQKDVAVALLEHYGFHHQVTSTIRGGRAGMAREYAQRVWSLLNLARRFRPDVITAVGGVFIAPVGRIAGVPSVVFIDTETVAHDRYLTQPFATVIHTPDCFLRSLGPRHRRYPGLHDLAYLHPNHFRADPSVLGELNVVAGEPYIILRFVGWNASHDLGESGFSAEAKNRIVLTLRRFGRIFITSELPLPADLEAYRLQIAPHRAHDALYYAALLMTDGGNMATEAGVLGTPSISSSTVVDRLGYFHELQKYQLVFTSVDFESALSKAVEMVQDPEAKSVWRQRTRQLLADKIDVAQYVTSSVLEAARPARPGMVAGVTKRHAPRSADSR